jgi:hypothetical protein
MGQPGYERLGYTAIKDGVTWTFGDEAQSRPPATEAERLLAEKIATGDVAGLSEFVPSLPPDAMNATLASGFTATGLAGALGRHAVAEWLVAHGGALTVLTAWELGWKDRARALLKESPGRVNELHGKYSASLLHEAVLRDDIDLARFVLAANPELTIKDAIHDSTALGWARFFGREEMATLIEENARERGALPNGRSK